MLIGLHSIIRVSDIKSVGEVLCKSGKNSADEFAEMKFLITCGRSVIK